MRLHAMYNLGFKVCALKNKTEEMAKRREKLRESPEDIGARKYYVSLAKPAV
jgi:hypothetical protein